MSTYGLIKIGADRTDHAKNYNEPEIWSEKNQALVKVFDWFFGSVIKKYFYSVRVKNVGNYDLRNPAYGNLFYGAHTCYWDGILATYLCRNLFNSSHHMMIESLYRFPILAKVGGFSVDKKSPRGIMSAINHSVRLLSDPEKSLWIFPQGRVCPPGSRPIVFENGITHIASKLKGVNLIPVAYNYTFLRQEKPEILVEIGKPVVVENGIRDKKLFTKNLQQEFERLLDSQKQEISAGNLEGYEFLMKKWDWKTFTEGLLEPLLRVKVN